MSVSLNHTIIHSRDRQAAAEFLAGVLGLEVGTALARSSPCRPRTA
jgi:catechol 2,3-dioxygenase-like lactoylglutathione lyase family enzyme